MMDVTKVQDCSEDGDSRKQQGMKRLEDDDVRQICAGQIISTLAVAIKELVENALDAGSTNVEVILKDYGSTVIEVRDNGPGIEKENRPLIALKNYTSKISQFSDIYDLHTYGFRGEAVNSLCTIGDVSIITRHADDICGVLLVFDKTGGIVEEQLYARTVGTTVFVKNIFSSFPVRRKFLLANLKKEFAKVVEIIRAYALVTVGARIACSHQVGEKPPSTLLVTDGTSVKDNIRSTFGLDQVKNLLTISSELPDQQTLDDFKVTVDEVNDFNIDLEGYISSCDKGDGRGSRDRQFLYVNSRPCDYEKINRLINSIYHQYQKRKYPFLYLNIKVPNDCVDVNCSPDKREIFLKSERLMLATLKSSLCMLYGSVHAMKTVDIGKLPAFTNSVVNKSSVTIRENSFCETSVSNQNDSIMSDVTIESEVSILNVTLPEDISLPDKDESLQRPKVVVYDENLKCCNTERRETVIDSSILMQKIEATNENDEKFDDQLKNSVINRFRAAMDPTQNEIAERELRQNITEEMFSKMNIIGQLNNSFIVVSLDCNLFIIDQHAADEKYNFEMLMKQSVVPSQRLAIPQQLELHTHQEEIVSEYFEVFKRNGFDFKIDNSADPSKRVFLTSIPLSKKQALGREDLLELIAMLEECPDSICRPSKIRAMFASRACRKSVMMGTSLSESTMRTIVDHMGDLDDPWKCPHGRPSMRHLFDLNKMKNKDFDRNIEL